MVMGQWQGEEETRKIQDLNLCLRAATAGPASLQLFPFIASAETALESCLMRVQQPVSKPMANTHMHHCPLAAEPDPLLGTSQRFLFSLRNRNQEFVAENTGFSRYFGNGIPNSLSSSLF